MNKQDKELYCHYSGLPSPMAYMKSNKQKHNAKTNTKNTVLVEHKKNKKTK